MEFFDKIIKRVVSFPLQSYEHHGSGVEEFIKMNRLFELSVLTASPSLYDDLSKGKIEKIQRPLQKYFFRAHNNPVPFGTFSSVGCISWGQSTYVTKTKELTLKIGIDNFYYANLLKQELNKDWQNHNYITNPSVHYLRDGKVSFYKTDVKNSGAFETDFVELDSDENTQWIIDRFKEAVPMRIVQNELVEEGFANAEVASFLQQIISVGLIINKHFFEPYNTGPLAVNKEAILLSKNTLTLGNSKEFENFIHQYTELTDKADKAGVPSKQSHSITAFDTTGGSLDHELKKKILRYIDFTVAYNSNYKPVNDKLKQFGFKFYHHFTDGYIPIGKVFNPYSGLKYSAIRPKQEFKFPEKLLQKIIFQEGSSKDCIIFDDSPVQSGYLSLPATFGVIFEVLKNKVNGDEIIFCKSLGGATAINMLTRFGHVTSDLCKDISDFEEAVNKEKLLAEINMIPQSRAKNIFSDRQYYSHNIPLNTSPGENPINIADIYMRFNGESFDVISGIENKVIIPRLISAVDYSSSNFEFYRFLCDLQYQDGEIYSVNFDMNSYTGISVPYIPRIYLGSDILLYPAQLLFTYKDQDLCQFRNYVTGMLEKYCFGARCIMPDKKGDIIINKGDDHDLKYLADELKKRKFIYVSEYIYESFSPVVTEEGKDNNYAHEFLVSIKNTNYKANQVHIKYNNTEKESTHTNAEWLYVELYCNSYAENEIIKNVYQSLLSDGSSQKFFFVRYNHPSNHLRMRFLPKSMQDHTRIIAYIRTLYQSGFISHYSVVPYLRELYRYGGVELMECTESLFSADTADSIENWILSDSKDNHIFVFSVLKLKAYYELFNLSAEEMILHCDLNINAFSREFRLDVEMKKRLAKTYNNLKGQFNTIQYSSLMQNQDIGSILSLLKANDMAIGGYLADIVHMSMNRLFSEKQRFNEFKTYYLARKYFQQLKFRK